MSEQKKLVKRSPVKFAALDEIADRGARALVIRRLDWNLLRRKNRSFATCCKF
jgi:hypothetical protein